MRRTIAIFGILVGGLGLMLGNQQPQLAIIVATAISAPLTVAQLDKGADIVAVVRPTGANAVHWNSAANTAWTTDGPARPMIYNDQEVVVIDLIRGSADKTLTVRNVGGLVGDTRYELEGLEPLVKGQLYLLFLENVETPTKEGSQPAISFVGMAQGVFAADGGGFVNDLGLTVSVEQVGR